MIIHDSRELFYRIPFGAVEFGTTVILRLKFLDESLPEKCKCNIWKKGFESEIDMQYTKAEESFECTVEAVSDGDPLWYYFVFIYSDGRMLFYGNNDNLTGGEGRVFDSEPLSYQITVYKKGFKTPSWWKEGPVYHIFVDRFFNSYSYINPEPNPRPHFYYHENWNESPLYLPHGNQPKYFPDDVFGGNLNGIIDKLSYIKSLGVRTIYLSPIFEAQSNHKYDTSDYNKIDSDFGNTKIFNELCEKASQFDIKIILDGVFSHTGDDSIYFNKLNKYDSLGAYQSVESPYYDWYSFEDFPDKYTCWWDVETMPTVNKDNTGFRNLIYGDDGIAQLWLGNGASGWRLDVADELPMDFLRGLRTGIKSENHDALIIGEVWEDASNKVSYGNLRNYCYGNTLDSVMNYPLREAILGFILGKINSASAVELFNSQMENYPAEFLNASMNLLGSHDRARLKSVMSGAPDPDTLTRTEQAKYIPDPIESKLSESRIKCATALMFTIPGVPYIYYGDETGLTGLADPFNRKTYPWGNEDDALIDFFKFIGNFRNSNSILIKGKTTYYSFGDDVIGCLRSVESNYIFTIINRNALKNHSIEFTLPSSEPAKNFVTNEPLTPSSAGSYKLELSPLSYTILTT
ncbi:MAG: glycoside hydrolase family 13 protein [Clostridiales bacterium]|nr:glycoside hydrolase family 13 protein [Clostridiales bacterium]